MEFFFRIIEGRSALTENGGSTDIDECQDRPGICSNGECNNFQGSFQCVCRNGYTLTPSRDSCIDIDECQRNPNICNNGTCINTLGSYKCHCYAGFKLSANNDCAGRLPYSDRNKIWIRLETPFDSRVFFSGSPTVRRCGRVPFAGGYLPQWTLPKHHRLVQLRVRRRLHAHRRRPELSRRQRVHRGGKFSF